MENLEMTEQEKADLEASKLLAGLYCDGCGECLPQCKKHLPVNELMRAFMYTYGYRQAEKASVLLNEMAVAANPCSDCTGCEVKCVKGFPVQERIADVSRLVDVPRDLISYL
jgi:hypothetical protein